MVEAPSMTLIRLDEGAFVAGQIAPEDITGIAAAGVRTIVNNRPDGEQAGQPDARQIEEAAQASGLEYRFIPVAGGISNAQIGAMAEILGNASAPVLAFCRSGTRSTFLWALARSRLGDDPDEIVAKADAAGFDLAPIAAFLHNR
jgi:uncharacterized protein (TIGR01244 family)